MPDDPTNTDAFAALQAQVQDLSDAFDSLNYTTLKKLGPAPASIQGSVMNSVNFKTGVSGWQMTPDGNLEANNGYFRGDITGASGTFSGTVNVGSLNIPDSTTANSAHVDSSGNTWWGANVADGISNAKASITDAGLATFKNILVGGATIQYQVVNAGMFSFGDSSDGTVTWDGTTTILGMAPSSSIYTLTRDIYISTGTINSGVTINTAGYRIFCAVSLTINGKIDWSGNPGSTATDFNGAAGGAALANGYLVGSPVGTTGGKGWDAGGGVATSSSGGGSVSNSLGGNGSKGGGGGNDDNSHTGAGSGSGGTATTSNVKLIANWHLATLLDISSTGSTVKFTTGAGASGGGGGAGNPANGGGGGGAGSGGGTIAIYAKSITIGATGVISANGGHGGNGAAGSTNGGNHGGGGGGGAGGSGGTIVLVYNTLTNGGSIAAAGGTKGTGGASGGGTATAGADGTNGGAGATFQFQISM